MASILKVFNIVPAKDANGNDIPISTNIIYSAFPYAPDLRLTKTMLIMSNFSLVIRNRSNVIFNLDHLALEISRRKRTMYYKHSLFKLSLF